MWITNNNCTNERYVLDENFIRRVDVAVFGCKQAEKLLTLH